MLRGPPTEFHALPSSILTFLMTFLKNYFSITGDIQYYFALVSGVQRGGWTIIEFTKCPPSVSSTHPAPHVVITTLLTVFPVPHFTSLWLFCSYRGGTSHSLHLFHPAPSPSPLAATSLFSVSVSLLLFCLFVYFVLYIPHMSEITRCFSFSV